jgi:hypothetical protein
MTGSEFSNQIAFNENLYVGQVVQARWTNSFNSYACNAEVVKVNAKSLRVSLLTVHGPYLAGHVIVLPKIYANTWSANNGAFPGL